MRFVSFHRNGETAPGIVEDERVRVLSAPSLIAYIAMPHRERVACRTEETIPLEGLRLAAPVKPPRNVFCVGRNYLEHAKEGARVLGKALNLPDVPTFFSKATTAVADPNATLHWSARASSQYDYEAELAVVIGTRCKDVSASDAMANVFGYTCLNDATARDLQRAHLQWLKGKSLDDLCPIGPWIVTPDEVGDPQSLAISMRVNGVEKQSSTTSQMIFPIARLIEELSKGMTLLPGDVIATGTPDGVGFARTPPEFVHDGDTLEVTVEKIGTLRNTVRIE